MTYHILAEFAQTGGLVYFVGLFLAAIVYALWPRNRASFERASRLPLGED